MGKVMISSRTRYTLPVAMLLGYIIIYGIVEAYRGGLTNVDFVTGWVLCTIIFFQSLYQGRKFGQIKTGTGATWLNLHVLMGSLSLLVFMFHLEWRWPTGAFEIIFTLIFLCTAMSGIMGMMLYRTLPRHFIQGDEELTFQRIPQLVRKIRKQAEDIALGSVDESKATMLADYYNEYFAQFLLRPQLHYKHIFGASKGVITELKSTENLICRVLSEDEVLKVKELLTLAEEKNQLDCQYTLKYAIKAWLFVHAPLAFTTILVTIIHTIIIYAYAS